MAKPEKLKHAIKGEEFDEENIYWPDPTWLIIKFQLDQGLPLRKRQ